MSRFSRSLALAATATLLAACAPPPVAPPKDSGAAQMGELRADQKQLSQRLDKLQQDMSRLEEQFRNQQQTLVQLQRDVEHKSVTESRQSAAQPELQAHQAPAPAASRALPAQNLSASEIYLQAFSDHASQRYPEAIQGFELFLANFPTNSYAGNAQYWLGECYFAMGKFDKAATELLKTYERYPSNPKAPEALARLAESLTLTNQADRANQVLQTLRSRYPNSEAAKKSPQ